MPAMRNLYVLLFSLYWAQGLPVGFMTHALPVILRAQGVSLTHIGGFGLLMLPWSIKVLGTSSRSLWFYKGHYRSWIIPAQLLSVIVLIILSFIPIEALNQPVYLLAFCGTTIYEWHWGDTGYCYGWTRGQYSKNEQQHWGNTFQVIGSRLGFIVGGGAVLWLLDFCIGR